MASNIAEFKIIVERIVKDLGLDYLQTGDVEQFIAEGIEQYNLDRPLLKVYDQTPSTDVYEFDVPTDWLDEFSNLIAVEYPVGGNPPTYLNRDYYGIYRGTSLKIRFYYNTITASAQVLIHYTTKHTIDVGQSTVYANDEWAFANLVASLCLRAMSNRAAQHTDPSINASIVNFHSKAAEFSTAMERCRKLYDDHFGKTKKGEDRVKASDGIKTFDLRDAFGDEYLTHRKEKSEIFNG